MKTSLYTGILLSLLLLLLFNSCNKEKEIDFNKLNIKAVTTVSATEIKRNTATITGKINTDNGASVSGAGVLLVSKYYDRNLLYSGSPIPATFTIKLENLTPGTEHWFTAYASNKFGTAQGEPISFTTEKAVPATVNTLQFSNVTRNSATVSGSITDNGGYPVTSRGVCYSHTTDSPRIENNPNIRSGSGNGNFSGSLVNLTPGTRYYARAFAVTEAGTSYGSAISFTTSTTSPPGDVTITGIGNITYNSAFLSGRIGDDGGLPVTSRGFVYSNLNPNPIIGSVSSVQSVVPGTGNFSATISGLISNMNYYIRAFASNSAGMTYGEVMQFKTLGVSVGQSYQGGTIAYLFQQGDPGYVQGEVHGLIVASVITERVWGCQGANINTYTVIGAGSNNTINIVSSCGGSNAARYCYDLSHNGYSDWYLPSYNELLKIHANRTPVGISNFFYWTSTQYPNSSQHAYVINFSTTAPGVAYSTKNSNFYALPVRSF